MRKDRIFYFYNYCKNPNSRVYIILIIVLRYGKNNDGNMAPACPTSRIQRSRVVTLTRARGSLLS